MINELSDGSLDYMFGAPLKESIRNNNYKSLNDGFELRPIELTDVELENQRIVSMEYSHLYKDGIKISDEIFRKGGLCTGFKEGYCVLLHYIRTNEPGKNNNGFSFGKSVIVNTEGKICLEGKGLEYPYHNSGNLGTLGDYYYNLLTGEKICHKPSSVVKGKEYLYLEFRYNFGYHKVKIPVGVYKLNKMTLELTKIDDIK